MARLKRLAGNALTDGLALAGAGLVAYGAWLAWPPAGAIVGGLALIGFSVLLGLREERE